MDSKKLDAQQFLLSFDEVVSELLLLIATFTKEEINRHPYDGSWSAAQVTEHITKSIASVRQALQTSGKIIDREADERVAEIKAMFLDFSLKFKAAEALLPTATYTDTTTLVSELTGSVDLFKQAAREANLSEAIPVPGFGELTKFELLYLALYHTYRHIQQIKNLRGMIFDKQDPPVENKKVLRFDV